ncbi:MAG: FliO/MopB family protein [Candidatus Gastranaerophilales bacterium]|nr:FliO/MopB family protein [Candidatus Gastranaerophilales bacterium]
MKKVFVFNLLTISCFALENTEKTEEISNIIGQNVYEPNYFGMVLGLFLVVGMIYLTGYLYQKLIKTNSFNNNFALNKPQIISTTSIGQGRNLHVIKMGNDAFLIGATQNNITYIKSVDLIENKEEKNVKNS